MAVQYLKKMALFCSPKVEYCSGSSLCTYKVYHKFWRDNLSAVFFFHPAGEEPPRQHRPRWNDVAELFWLRSSFRGAVSLSRRSRERLFYYSALTPFLESIISRTGRNQLDSVTSAILVPPPRVVCVLVSADMLPSFFINITGVNEHRCTSSTFDNRATSSLR